jgi:hypothetical protein
MVDRFHRPVTLPHVKQTSHGGAIGSGGTWNVAPVSGWNMMLAAGAFAGTSGKEVAL